MFRMIRSSMTRPPAPGFPLTGATVVGALAAALFTVGLAAPASAEASPLRPILTQASEAAGDPFLEVLYNPEVVLELANTIKLSDEQRKKIIDVVVDAEAQSMRVGFEAMTDMNALVDALTADTIDPMVSMSVIEEFLKVEFETRRLFLESLVKVANILTPAQRAQLDRIREQERADVQEG